MQFLPPGPYDIGPQEQNRRVDRNEDGSPDIPEINWREHCEEARFEIDSATGYRSQKDDPKEERTLRLIRLRNAKDELEKAIAQLEAR